MMEQPSGEQKPDQSSGQDQDPKPNPNVESGAVATRANGEAGRLQGETQQSDHNNSSNNGPENGSDHNDEMTLNHTRSKKSVRWSEELVMESRTMRSADAGGGGGSGGGSNPYVASSPAPSYSTSFKNSLSTPRDVLGRWGNRVGEATRAAEALAGNTWQH